MFPRPQSLRTKLQAHTSLHEIFVVVVSIVKSQVVLELHDIFGDRSRVA
jgi:hypothetical protein